MSCDGAGDSLCVHRETVAKLRGIGGHGVLQSGSEGQHFVLHLNGVGGILREVFGLSRDDRDGFALQVELLKSAAGTVLLPVGMGPSFFGAFL